MFVQVPLAPEQASTLAPQVDGLFHFLVALTLFFSGLIAILIVVFCIKYRRRSDVDRPTAIKPSLGLELTWTLVPLGIVLLIFFWGARIFFTWARVPDDAMEIYCVGQQWMWRFQHLRGQREINELHVPVGRPVKLTMISQDVIHSFFVPAFRVHQDVLPNYYTTTWFQATKPGRYHLFCSQYCGTNHARMVGTVVVMDREAFQTWLERGVDGGLAAEGRKLFLKLQCVTCHSADAKARAPVLENIYGMTVPLQGGATVRAEEGYLRESILVPDAKVVAGYQPIMPSYQGQVNEEEIQQLIAFLKALGPGQTPPRVEWADAPEASPALKAREENKR